MKKFIITFFVIVLFIFILNNFVFSEKIVCEVDKGNFEAHVSLVLYNGSDETIKDLWIRTLSLDELNDKQKTALSLINGIEIHPQDKWYDQIIKLIDQSNNTSYDPLNPAEYDEQITNLNIEIFKILGWIIYEEGFRI